MPTLTNYRRRFARLAGEYQSGTATSGSTTGLLEATAWPFKSNLSKATWLKDMYLYRAAAAATGDLVRQIITYAPATGKMTPDQTYTNAAYSGSTGEAFEIHGVIEPHTALRDILNEALKRIPVEVEFTFSPGTATATRHSLASAASWLTNPLHIYQVGYLTSGEARADNDPFRRTVRGEAFKDGATVYLTGFSFDTSVTVYVKARKPAYDHCRASSGGTFGDRAGLDAEAHEAVPDEEWVAMAMLVEAWDRFSQTMRETADQRGQKDFRDQAEAAARLSTLTNENWAEPVRIFRPRPIAFGPRWS